MSQEDAMPDDKQKLPELAKERLARVGKHLKDNQKVYLVGAGCFAAGYLLRGKCPDVVQTFANSSDNVVAVVNRSKNVEVVIQYVKQRNYVANPVRCLETGMEWPSQAEAAEALRIAAAIMSKHLNGKLEHANGFHFERI